MAMTRRHMVQGALLTVAGAVPLARRPVTHAPAWAGTPLAALLPARFGGWDSSQDEAAIVLPASYDRMSARNYDTQLARVYHRAGSADILMVVACAASQLGGLLVHRPESCYPAAGFEISFDHALAVKLGAARQVAGRYLTAQCDARIEQVLYWIRIGGDFPTTSWAEQWSAARAALGGVLADGVLVRLSTVSADAAAALPDVAGFAAELYAAAGDGGRRLLVGGA